MYQKMSEKVFNESKCKQKKISQTILSPINRTSIPRWRTHTWCRRSSKAWPTWRRDCRSWPFRPSARIWSSTTCAGPSNGWGKPEPTPGSLTATNSGVKFRQIRLTRASLETSLVVRRARRRVTLPGTRDLVGSGTRFQKRFRRNTARRKRQRTRRVPAVRCPTSKATPSSTRNDRREARQSSNIRHARRQPRPDRWTA